MLALNGFHFMKGSSYLRVFNQILHVISLGEISKPAMYFRVFILGREKT